MRWDDTAYSCEASRSITIMNSVEKQWPEISKADQRAPTVGLSIHGSEFNRAAQALIREQPCMRNLALFVWSKVPLSDAPFCTPPFCSQNIQERLGRGMDKTMA